MWVVTVCLSCFSDDAFSTHCPSWVEMDGVSPDLVSSLDAVRTSDGENNEKYPMIVEITSIRHMWFLPLLEAGEQSIKSRCSGLWQ